MRIVLAFVRAHLVLLAAIVLVVVLYALAGFFLAPRIAHAQLQQFVNETLHKRATLGEVRFNPFTFEASIAGLLIRELDDRPIVGFRHLYVNAELASVWRKAIVLKEVELSAPDVRLVVSKNGDVNLAQLVPPEEPGADDEQGAAIGVHIGRLAVREGRASIEDHSRPRTFRAAIEPIRFTLNDFKTDAGYRNDYRFAGVTNAGEELDWSGAFTVQPLGSTGQFSVRNLKLATIESLAGDALPFRISGAAHIKGDYDFALDPLELEIHLPLIAVRSLELKEKRGAAAAPITTPEIDVQHIAFSYARRSIDVQRVDIRDARIDVAREGDGTMSIMRLFGDAAPDSSTPPVDAQDGAAEAPAAEQPIAAEAEDAAGADWTMRVATLHIDNASILAEDRTLTPAARFQLAPASLTINNWTTAPDATVQVDGDVTFNETGRIKAAGEVQIEPLSAALKIDVADIPTPAAQPYIAQSTAMTLHSGGLSAKGDLSLTTNPDGAFATAFRGDIRIADLRTTDQHVNEDLVRWRELALTGVEFQQQPNKLAIDRIVARQPYASVIIAEDASLNVTRVLNRDATAATNPNEETDPDLRGDAEAEPERRTAVQDEPSFPISIRSVQIIDGAANFADYNIEPSFATAIMELNGKVTGLSSNLSSRAQVALVGKVDKYAPVDISGVVNLLSAAKYTDLAMNFRNMELTTFNPYSGKFAGYNISRGKLSTELKYLVEDRKLRAEHHIVLDNLEFGAKTDSKDAAPIPVKLAVALLKDRQGVIDVQLPVSGTLDDPKFRLGPIIWKAFLGLLTKIVTAPFAALGALFGGGDELAYVDFPAGSAELTQAERDKLTTLARALVERPQLRLNVPLTVASTEDADAIAQGALQARAPALDATLDAKMQRDQLKALEAVYREALKSAPVYPAELSANGKPDPVAQSEWLRSALLAQLRPDAEALDALARQRARAVQDALLANAELNPERVFITNERTAAKTDAGSVRMELKLE